MKCEVFQPYIKSNYYRKPILFGGQTTNSIGNSGIEPNISSEKIFWGPVLSSDKFQTQIGNFYRVDENFFRGAQPGIDESLGGAINHTRLKEDLKYLRDKFGITVILNLRNIYDNNTNHIELEKQAIKELNEEAELLNAKNPSGPKIPKLKGLNIPMSAGDIVRSEQVEEIMGYFKDYSNEKMFVHCRSGNDRTGVATALRRIWKRGTENGVSFENIREEMIKCGHRQDIFPNLISSLAACMRYMGITPDFSRIANARGEKNFLSAFYQRNRLFIKMLAFGK